MDDLIDDLTKIPLSGDDLIDIVVKLGGDRSKTGWITYNGLQEVNEINELFNPDPQTTSMINSVFILFTPPDTNIGHWVVLINNDKGIFFMDPYGLSISEDIRITMSNNKLLELLMGHNVSENSFQYQMFGSDADEVNTCGRWAAIRAFMFWASNDEFQKIVMPVIEKKQVDTLDTFANLLTGFLSNSDKVVEMFLMNPPTTQEQLAAPQGINQQQSNIGGVLTI